MDRVQEIIDAAPKLALQVGPLNAVTFVALHTAATASADGFGTLTIYDGGTDGREVFVHVQHARWQIERYLSCMPGATRASEGFDTQLMADEVWRAMQRGFGARED